MQAHTQNHALLWRVNPGNWWECSRSETAGIANIRLGYGLFDKLTSAGKVWHRVFVAVACIAGDQHVRYMRACVFSSHVAHVAGVYNTSQVQFTESNLEGLAAGLSFGQPDNFAAVGITVEDTQRLRKTETFKRSLPNAAKAVVAKDKCALQLQCCPKLCLLLACTCTANTFWRHQPDSDDRGERCIGLCRLQRVGNEHPNLKLPTDEEAAVLGHCTMECAGAVCTKHVPAAVD